MSLDRNHVLIRTAALALVGIGASVVFAQEGKVPSTVRAMNGVRHAY